MLLGEMVHTVQGQYSGRCVVEVFARILGVLKPQLGVVLSVLGIVLHPRRASVECRGPQILDLLQTVVVLGLYLGVEPRLQEGEHVVLQQVQLPPHHLLLLPAAAQQLVKDDQPVVLLAEAGRHLPLAVLGHGGQQAVDEAEAGQLDAHVVVAEEGDQVGEGDLLVDGVAGEPLVHEERQDAEGAPDGQTAGLLLPRQLGQLLDELCLRRAVRGLQPAAGVMLVLHQAVDGVQHHAQLVQAEFSADSPHQDRQTIGSDEFCSKSGIHRHVFQILQGCVQLLGVCGDIADLLKNSLSVLGRTVGQLNDLCLHGRLVLLCNYLVFLDSIRLLHNQGIITHCPIKFELLNQTLEE